MSLCTGRALDLQVGDRLDTTTGLREVLRVECLPGGILGITVQCPASPPKWETTLRMRDDASVRWERSRERQIEDLWQEAGEAFWCRVAERAEERSYPVGPADLSFDESARFSEAAKRAIRAWLDGGT